MENFNLETLRQQALAMQFNSHKMVWEENDFAIFRDITEIQFAHRPTRLDMAVFGLCQSGECDLLIDSNNVHFTAGDYIVLFPNQVVQILEHETPSNTQGIFICLSNKLYNEMLQHVQTTPMLLYIRQHPCAPLKEEDIAWITRYHELIFQEMQAADNIFRASTAKSLMAALFFKVCNLYGHSIFSAHPARNRQEEIFTQFLKLLTQHFRQEHTISFYADKLFITPKYLSSIVKDVSGESANKWIQSFVIKEAKILLQTTHLNVQQITNYLSFPSQSFFGKYFKQHTGMSPQQFRKQSRA